MEAEEFDAPTTFDGPFDITDMQNNSIAYE
jgi:hypothetical protein